MEIKEIARKSNFSLITWISGIVMMLVVILIPSEYNLLNYLAIIVLIYFSIRLILHLLQPNVSISQDDEKIYINRPFKVLAIDPQSVSNVVIKVKSRRAVKYAFGKIILTLKNGQSIVINNVDDLEKVRSVILTFIRKK